LFADDTRILVKGPNLKDFIKIWWMLLFVYINGLNINKLCNVTTLRIPHTPLF
jgi:hypothetical protein